jgi:hypothetical protein
MLACLLCLQFNCFFLMPLVDTFPQVTASAASCCVPKSSTQAEQWTCMVSTQSTHLLLSSTGQPCHLITVHAAHISSDLSQQPAKYANVLQDIPNISVSSLLAGNIPACQHMQKFNVDQNCSVHVCCICSGCVSSWRRRGRRTWRACLTSRRCAQHWRHGCAAWRQRSSR